MGTLRYPAPESFRTTLGLTVHAWPGGEASSSGTPVLLIHGFASNTLFNWVKTGWLDPLSESGQSESGQSESGQSESGQSDSGQSDSGLGESGLGSPSGQGFSPRTVLSVDLPGHGASQDVDPAGIRTAEILDDLRGIISSRAGSAVALHGYSLGSRLAWQFAHDYPEDVASLVMGGSPVSDDIDRVDTEQARAWAAGGEEPSDELTRKYITVAAALPDQHLQHVVELRLSLARDRYRPAETVPAVPTLVVAGAKDPIAVGAERLAEWVRGTGAEAQFVKIPGRNHVNVLTSREYKQAVLDFI